MLCISRYTDETYAQHFGDGRHKFYLEFRCNRPCTNGIYCSKCSNKSPLTTLQQSRKFNHGAINEAIPNISHIFGGKWYNDGIKKWGPPPSEIIEFAIKYRNEAHEGFESATIETTIIPLPLNPVKPQKSKVALEPILEPILEPTLEPTSVVVVPKKRGKPKVAGEPTDGSEPKKRVVRKKPIVTPYSTLINATSQIVHKEVSLPTHIESKMEEIDCSGYMIQYIKLSVFEANSISYFRDVTKNKLYKKVKDKIGGYVGRWNPDTDSIITDIPDSDDEE